MSGDPEQEYFADGMVEEITSALGRIRWFFVIARNSAFTYKGRAVDVRQVGRELGVRYVLEGSVQKLGDRLRLNAQLIETVTGDVTSSSLNVEAYATQNVEATLIGGAFSVVGATLGVVAGYYGRTIGIVLMRWPRRETIWRWLCSNFSLRSSSFRSKNSTARSFRWPSTVTTVVMKRFERKEAAFCARTGSVST